MFFSGSTNASYYYVGSEAITAITFIVAITGELLGSDIKLYI
jgi:hypothetical protein